METKKELDKYVFQRLFEVFYFVLLREIKKNALPECETNAISK